MWQSRGSTEACEVSVVRSLFQLWACLLLKCLWVDAERHKRLDLEGFCFEDSDFRFGERA